MTKLNMAFRQAQIKLDCPNDAITPENVRLVLLHPFSSDPKPTVLEQLRIVDERVANQFFPDNAFGRRMALVDILVSIITDQLQHHRQAMDIPCQPSDKTLQQAFMTIDSDVKTDNPYLIGWSWVYYRFVRLDLNINQQMYVKCAHLDDRTIRRYQGVTFARMATLLSAQETTVRRALAASTQASLRTEFSQNEVIITLKAETILQLIKSEPSVFNAVAKWLRAEQIKEIEDQVATAWDEPFGGWKGYAESVLNYVQRG
jgi:hypothetical protein